MSNWKYAFMAEFEGIANKSYSQISKEEKKWRIVKKIEMEAEYGYECP